MTTVFTTLSTPHSTSVSKSITIFDSPTIDNRPLVIGHFSLRYLIGGITEISCIDFRIIYPGRKTDISSRYTLHRNTEILIRNKKDGYIFIFLHQQFSRIIVSSQVTLPVAKAIAGTGVSS